MFSQSVFAQLVRMLLVLILALVALHQFPSVFELFASQAMSSGCHQQTEDGAHSHHSSHHHH